MANILQQLGKILPHVQSPARYMGGEANSVVRDFAQVRGSIALLFPDIYEIGMSHNGTRVLYHCVNKHPDLLAEVAFAPWEDMAQRMREHDVPLYSHASYHPVRDFDVVGISLQTELNFTNVPYVLELSGIPVWARERSEADPLVAGGGPCMGNPEPVADFFDFFVIGDGEDLVPQLVRHIGEARKAGQARSAILKEIATWPGIYVPSLLDLAYNELGEVVPAAPAKGSYTSTQGIRRVWVPTLSAENYPVRNLVANLPLVHDRYAVEVMRGCTQGCRFCQAGYWYRPNRELDPDAVLDLSRAGLEATGERQLGLLSLSSADYGPIEKLTDAIIDDAFFDHVDVSLPSLRANSFGQSLARKVAALKGGRSATFAPETGSERLRKRINKTISDAEMLEAAHSVFSNGFTKIKLYTMVGLPTENLEDMEAFCGLIEALSKIGEKYGRRNQVHASIGILVPKPFTPLQWAPFMEKSMVDEHIRFVRERFRRHPGVRISWSEWSTAHLEAVYSRGDRRLAPLIYAAAQRGQVFESHSEKLNIPGWQQLWEEHAYDLGPVFVERAAEQVFPWDMLHIGVTKGYLRSEWAKMDQDEAEPVPDCKWGACQHCGIPGNGTDTQLAPQPQRYAAISRTTEEIQALVESRRPRRQDSWSYRFDFQKTALSRFLPHQNTLSFFERALGRLRIPIRFSEGFSPKPRIHNTGALPLGLSSLCEVVTIDLLQPLDLSPGSSVAREISAVFPAGMEIVRITPLDPKGLPRPVAMEYNLPGAGVHTEVVRSAWQQGTLAQVPDHRGRTWNLNEHVQMVAAGAQDALRIIVRANEQGNTISPFLVFAGLLGIPEVEARTLPLEKTRLFIAGEELK